MAIVQPDWIKAPDIAGDYARGLQIGTQVQNENARLQAESQRTQMEAQARAATLKREQTMEQQRLATDAAYKQSVIGLRKQQLDQVAKVNEQKTKMAAAKLQDQHGFASDLAGGMTVEQALFKHPGLATPQAAIAAHKEALDRSGDRIDLAQKRLDLAQQQFEARRNRPVETGETETTATDEDTGAKTTTRRKIYGAPGSQGDLSILGAPPATPSKSEFKSPGDVTAAYKAGKLSRKEAAKVLMDDFGIKEK